MTASGVEERIRNKGFGLQPNEWLIPRVENENEINAASNILAKKEVWHYWQQQQI